MSLFPSILVPLDGSRTAARSLGCATWLATRLGARLHLLSATPRELPAREELARLRVPREHWPLIALHQAPAYPAEAILAALVRHDIGLLVMTARGETTETSGAEAAPARILGHTARAVIERSPVPVLLLPPRYRETLPWERIVVPVSGEADSDEALATAVHLAHALDLKVSVVHVADPEPGADSLEGRTRYADALHHEYSSQLGELVERVLAGCAPAECGRIEETVLRRGDVAAELLELVDATRSGLLVLGWRGRLLGGHARVVRRLIRATHLPVLLVKPVARAPFRLNVGEELE